MFYIAVSKVTIASTRGTILKLIFTQWDFLFNNNNNINNMLETYSVAFSTVYTFPCSQAEKRKEKEIPTLLCNMLYFKA